MLQLHDRHAPGRAEVEGFIRSVYRERYGADVQQFAPILVSLHDGGELVAAAGYRGASREALFLERYLSAPVQALLHAAGLWSARREQIVEVGHLASRRAGAGRRLILLLAPHLASRGFEWVVSTLTEEMRKLFARMGIEPLTLGVADPSLLGADAAHWGSYYDHRPLVLVGRLDGALHGLAHRTFPG